MRPLCRLVLILFYTTLTVSNDEDKLLSVIAASTELPRPIKLWQNFDEDFNYYERNGRSRRPTLIDIALQASAREGFDAMTDLYGRIEPDIVRNGHILKENHPAALLSKFSAPQVDSEAREKAAYATITATKAFRKNYKYFDDLARQAHNQKISLRRTALEGLCPPRDPPQCTPASERYRTHDGTCNNKKRLRWGAAQMPFNRFLPPEYGDGVDTIRGSVEGGALSSSRFVSLLVHGARDGEAPLTLMIVQWGQLLDHDMTSTAQPRSINGSVPSCCGSKDVHPSCFPIKVPLDDPWLAPLKVRCLEFLRSAPAQRRDCVLSWREQTNQATSYIDASPIYSNNAKSSDNARVFKNGLLVFGRSNVNPAEDVCRRGAIATKCIRAGDGRSGEQPGLLALHHVWVGEHNRIATELSEINSHWSDEKVFQETRRIIGAMFQHITFREFLPIVLGREVVKLFDLELLSKGYFTGYNPKVNPSVANSFAAAAFRFGHSLVQNSYIRCDRHHNIINNNVSLHEEFQHGDIGTAGSLHRLIRGMAMQRALKRDEFITPELTNHLFQTPGFPFGLDLAAINIQRGRDHGVPAYTAWRVPCGLTPINTWDDFANVVGPESARRIGHAYRSVHDIDLFVGGIAERPVVGGLVGPTFACIIAQQFSNSRKGDRFWYENGGFESSFTPAQLHSIRRVSLAQVLCRTLEGGTFQPHIFIPPEFPGNSRQPCGVGDLAPIDLSAWQEQDPFNESPQQETGIVNDQILILSNISPQTLKEDKAGFSNRIPEVKNKTNAMNIRNKPNISLVPNSSIGFQRPKNTTRVSDKLDIKRKTTSTKRPTQNTLIGVNNKLDKRPKITLNIKGVNRLKVQTTTRRTVIINNVAIELRSAAGTDNQNRTDNDKLEPRTEENQGLDISENTENIEDMSVTTSTPTPSIPIDLVGQTDHDIDTDTTTYTPTLSTHNSTESLDPLKQTEIFPQLKRVQRKVHTPSDTTRTKVFSIDTPLSSSGQNTSTKLLLTNLKKRITTTTTSKPLKLTKTTKRSIELRHYHNAPIYTRPQKVVVNGAEADQYEIEINIRQTNKSPPANALTTYDDYTSAYRPLEYDRYTHNANYNNQGHSTTPIYQPIPQYPQSSIGLSVQAQYTKPPTIIYIDEDERTTTKAPGIFQNFLSFATNGFSNNRRPTDKEKPSTLSQSIFSTPRPPFQGEYPVATSSVSHIGNTGVISSAAISSNGYGAITGVASAGGDNIFSVNIRPRPSVPQTAIVSKPSGSSSSVSYGFYNPTEQKPIYSQSVSPSYINYPIPVTHINHHYDQPITHSPFSAGNQRPLSHTTQPFYSRLNRPQLKQGNDHKLGHLDYDYLSRTLETITDKSIDATDSDEYVYDYDSESLLLSTSKKFDKDGYLRPEHMIDTLYKSDQKKVLDETNNTTGVIDDDYVQGMLNNTEDKHNSSARHFKHNIAAQEESAAKPVNAQQLPTKSKHKVPFAPLTVLTNVERPDNWVIYNEPVEKPLLPDLPEIPGSGEAGNDVFSVNEIPKPIKNFSMVWLRKYLGNHQNDTVEAGTQEQIIGYDNSTPAYDERNETTTWETDKSTNSENLYSATENI